MSKKMSRQMARDHQAWKREREGRPISETDRAALELMRALRKHTHAAELGDGARALALQGLRNSIDRLAEVITGERDYFHAKHHSLCQGPRGTS